jgi:dipeptidyl aminopeptidase/acylaminoacyl peptidase
MLFFRSTFISIVTLCAIVAVAVIIIAYGRGYRLDVNKTSIKPTGLISATSDPVGAEVSVDGALKTATNNSFGIDPGFYTVRITKESYIPWEKKVRVQGEVVSAVNAFLFPTNPSLSPLTTPGIVNPTLSPDGTKVAYVIPSPATRAGLWYYELSEGPLGRNRDPIQIDQYTTFDFKQSQITWSPDTTQLLVENDAVSRLYTLGKPNTYTDSTLTRKTLLADWEAQKLDTERQKLAGFRRPIIDMATTSAKIISFSPDETKILYQATASATIPLVLVPPLIGTNSTTEDRMIKPGKFYVYDSREDKNYFLLDKKEISGAIHWFPTSRHLLLTLQNKIDIIEYDRTNWVTIYSGPFADNFVAPWSNGTRIIILTNLNGDALTLPNLYTVNLR